MRRILSLIAIPAMFSAYAFAGTWSGTLLDASCHDRNKTAACEPNSATAMFALKVGERVYKFDAAGNSKASAALKNRADRSDPTKTQAKEVRATVDGSEASGIITVAKIDVQ